MKRHIEKVDFLRGIAILLVFVYHASLVIFGLYYKNYNYSGFWLNYKSIPKIDVMLLFTPAAFGWSGVSLFLIISGFLIHYGTIKKDKFKPGLFFNKRFWRIWPPYFVALTFFFIFKGPHDLLNFFSHLFLIHNLFDTTVYGINPSFWSLALEMQLYLIYPLYLFLYKKLGNNKSLCIIAAISIVSYYVAIIFKLNSAALDKSIFNYWLIWVLGAYLAHVYHNNKRIININGLQLILFFVTIILMQLTVLYSYVSLYILAVFYTLLMDWFLNSKIKISSNVCKFIINVGLCSYSIYLIHQPYLWEIINVVRFGFYSFIIMAPLAFLFLYFISRVTYKYLELPSIMLGNKFYSLHKRKKLSSTINKETASPVA